MNNEEDNIKSVYLDYNATTPLADECIKSIHNSLINAWKNPSGNYEKSKISKALVNEARENIATMLNAESLSDIIFTSGGTEANNFVFYSAINHYYSSSPKNGQNSLNKPHFIISSIEHDSVKLIADHFRNRNIAEVTEIKANQNGTVCVERITNSIQKNTILISLMLANNETGVIQPVKMLTKKLLELGYNNEKIRDSKRLYIHTDAAQAIGKMKVDVIDLDVDYLTIVGHKFYGPRIGALFSRKCLSTPYHYYTAPIYPIFFGGGQENGLRPGTENTAMLIGLGQAAELVTKNLKKYVDHMEELRDYMESCLEREFGVNKLQFNGRSKDTIRLPNTCNVSFIGNEKLTGKRILGLTKHLEASTGACCHSSNIKSASRVLIAMGVPIDIANNAIRLSVGRETTKKDIDIAVNDLKQAVEYLQNNN